MARSPGCRKRSALSNYLFFTTRCEQALAFYAECGLGQITEMLRYGQGGMSAGSAAMRGRIMHARFEGPGVLFYASDNDDAEPIRSSAHILMMNDRARTEHLFGKLAEGGIVTTPLDVQPWGDFYGKLTDRFGVQWMLNCPLERWAPTTTGHSQWRSWVHRTARHPAQQRREHYRLDLDPWQLSLPRLLLNNGKLFGSLRSWEIAF